MSIQHILVRTLMAGAASASLLALPVGAAAQSQPYYGPAPDASYQGYHDCEQSKTGSTILGALLGAAIGGVLGSNIAAGGHRGDGTAVGIGGGAVVGGVVGNSSANCGGPPPQSYYDNGAYRNGYADRDYRYQQYQDRAPPPPAPPQYGYNDGRYGEAPPPPPPGYGDRYAEPPRYDDGRYGDAPPPPPPPPPPSY